MSCPASAILIILYCSEVKVSEYLRGNEEITYVSMEFFASISLYIQNDNKKVLSDSLPFHFKK